MAPEKPWLWVGGTESPIPHCSPRENTLGQPGLTHFCTPKPQGGILVPALLSSIPHSLLGLGLLHLTPSPTDTSPVSSVPTNKSPRVHRADLLLCPPFPQPGEQ